MLWLVCTIEEVEEARMQNWATEEAEQQQNKKKLNLKNLITVQVPCNALWALVLLIFDILHDMLLF